MNEEQYNEFKKRFAEEFNPGRALAKKRWEKEKPDPAYFRKLAKLSAASRKKGKKLLKPVKIKIDNS